MKGQATGMHRSVSTIVSSRAVVFLTVLILLIPGCSLFDPRDPEYPENPQNPPQTPTSPSAVMYNLDLALETLDYAAYMTCLDSSFVFDADPADVVEFGAAPYYYVFDDWGYDSEYNAVSALLLSTQGDSCPPRAWSKLPSRAFPAIPTRPLLWTAPPSGGTTASSSPAAVMPLGIPAEGRARITLVEDDQHYWYISRWEDSRLESSGDSLRTWGVTKAEYR